MVRVSVNATKYYRRQDQWIAKISAISQEVVEEATALIMARAIEAAPSPEQEMSLIMAGDYNTHHTKDNDKAESGRRRFLKDGPDQMYIKEALSWSEIIAVPRIDLKRSVGMNIAPVTLLDQITKFSWVNSTGGKTYQYTSPHGSFWSFEYGLSNWTVRPKNYSMRHRPGQAGPFLSPAPGEYTEVVHKSIPAAPMFTNINTTEIFGLLEAKFGQVR